MANHVSPAAPRTRQWAVAGLSRGPALCKPSPAPSRTPARTPWSTAQSTQPGRGRVLHGWR